MSTFSYAGIQLQPIAMKRYNRQTIMHGPTYLYTRHTLRVQGIYNGRATSYSGSSAKPVKQAEHPPAVTDAAIKHILMQPRQKLYFTAAFPNCDNLPHPVFPSSAAVINSPATPGSSFGQKLPSYPYITDCNFGPIPIACDVVRIGPNTWWVDFSIKADINECYNYFAKPAFVLSNRWNMTHDIDTNNFTTRYVRGRAIFRTDVMLQQKITPDDYRAAFFFPIPNNFQREQVRVWTNEDGNELHYSFVDREKSHTILLERITRIEAWATLSKQKQSVVDNAANYIGQNASSLMNFFGGISNATTSSSRRFRARAVASATTRGLFSVVGTAISSTASSYFGLQPMFRIGVNVRVWGNAMASRKNLLSVADAVIRLKLPQAFTAVGKIAYGEETSANFDLMGRYVDLSMTLIAGRVANGLGVTGLGIHSGPTDVFPELLTDNIGSGSNMIATIDPVAGKTMPNGAGTRGTYVEMCVAQAIQSVCALPTQPTQPYIETIPPYDKLPLPN